MSSSFKYFMPASFPFPNCFKDCKIHDFMADFRHEKKNLSAEKAHATCPEKTGPFPDEARF